MYGHSVWATVDRELTYVVRDSDIPSTSKRLEMLQLLPNCLYMALLATQHVVVGPVYDAKEPSSVSPSAYE